MLSGINAFNASFLDNVNQTQARIAKDQQQISSGIRVTQASDDPAAVSSILDYQEEIGARHPGRDQPELGRHNCFRGR